MPTDENNGVTPQQNQLGNPNLTSNSADQNQGVSTDVSQNSDDFDFNFNSDTTNPVVNPVESKPQNVQNPVEDQGISDVSQASDKPMDSVPQDGSNDKLQVDDNLQDFGGNLSSSNSDSDLSLNSSDTNASMSDEDSYLADIEPDDSNDDIMEPAELNNTSSQEDNQPTEVLDKEIQDMISFDEPAGDTGGSVQDVNKSSQENNETAGGSDDWLAQEDKKVEETFGTENSGEVDNSPDINVSSDVVAQNVESIMTEENNQTNNQYVPDEQEYSQMSDLLNSSNAGQVDLSNVDNQTPNTNMGGSTGMFGGVDVQPEQNAGTFGANNMEVQQTTTFQPSVDEQAQDTNMGGSTGMFGSVDVQSEQNTGTFGANNMEAQQTTTFQPSADVQDQNANMGGSTGTVGSVDSQANQAVGTFDISKLDAGSIPEGSQFGLSGLGVVAQDNYGDSEGSVSEVENSMPDTLNLDTIDDDIQNLNVGGQTQQFGSTQQFDSTQNQVQTQQQAPVQNVVAKKGKKQSGFKVIGIFLLVVAVLCALLYGASVMFPDKINLKSIFGGDKIVEYIDNSGIVGDSGLNENGDEVTPENGENSEDSIENAEENLGEGEGLDESDIDPNSLAALLDGDESGTDSELPGDDTEGEVTDIDEPASEIPDSDENFDAFAQVDELFDENTKNSDALKNYISKGEFYKNLGTEKNNPTMSKYGEYIMVTAQGELTKLENGEEIDTTLFSKFDDLLEKVSSLSD